jgi:hypothetical protein
MRTEEDFLHDFALEVRGKVIDDIIKHLENLIKNQKSEFIDIKKFKRDIKKFRK